MYVCTYIYKTLKQQNHSSYSNKFFCIRILFVSALEMKNNDGAEKCIMGNIYTKETELVC